MKEPITFDRGVVDSAGRRGWECVAGEQSVAMVAQAGDRVAGREQRDGSMADGRLRHGAARHQDKCHQLETPRIDDDMPATGLTHSMPPTPSWPPKSCRALTYRVHRCLERRYRWKSA